jgi:hypothetical protein
MGLVTYPAIVNIFTLVTFFVYLLISIYLIARQGLGRSSPWLWLALLAVCRLTQVSLDLAKRRRYSNDHGPDAAVHGDEQLT